MIVTFGRRLAESVERVGDVLRQNTAIEFKEKTDVRRKRVNGLVDHYLVAVLTPR